MRTAPAVIPWFCVGLVGAGIHLGAASPEWATPTGHVLVGLAAVGMVLAQLLQGDEPEAAGTRKRIPLTQADVDEGRTEGVTRRAPRPAPEPEPPSDVGAFTRPWDGGRA